MLIIEMSYTKTAFLNIGSIHPKVSATAEAAWAALQVLQAAVEQKQEETLEVPQSWEEAIDISPQQ